MPDTKWIEYMFQREIEELERTHMPLYAEAHNAALKALKDKDESVEIIKDLLYQFAYPGEKNGRAMLWTGGVSALEWGFKFMGWDNPHFTPELECNYPCCHLIAECGTPTPDGYKRLCGKHFNEIQSHYPNEAYRHTPQKGEVAYEMMHELREPN